MCTHLQYIRLYTGRETHLRKAWCNQHFDHSQYRPAYKLLKNGNNDNAENVVGLSVDSFHELKKDEYTHQRTA